MFRSRFGAARHGAEAPQRRLHRADPRELAGRDGRPRWSRRSSRPSTCSCTRSRERRRRRRPRLPEAPRRSRCRRRRRRDAAGRHLGLLRRLRVPRLAGHRVARRWSSGARREAAPGSPRRRRRRQRLLGVRARRLAVPADVRRTSSRRPPGPRPRLGAGRRRHDLTLNAGQRDRLDRPVERHRLPCAVHRDGRRRRRADTFDKRPWWQPAQPFANSTYRMNSTSRCSPTRALATRSSAPAASRAAPVPRADHRLRRRDERRGAAGRRDGRAVEAAGTATRGCPSPGFVPPLLYAMVQGSPQAFLDVAQGGNALFGGPCCPATFRPPPCHRVGLAARRPGRGPARRARLMCVAIGILFAVGSACFLVAALASQWASTPRAAIGITFFAGSLCFTSAAYLQHWLAVRDAPRWRRGTDWSVLRPARWPVKHVKRPCLVHPARRHRLLQRQHVRGPCRPDLDPHGGPTCACGRRTRSARSASSSPPAGLRGRLPPLVQPRPPHTRPGGSAAMNLLGSITFGVSPPSRR